MGDPRGRLGVEVHPSVWGPYETRQPNRSSPDQGGLLDVGIMARTLGGQEVVIGEIWAAALGKDGKKIRIDARAIAQRIADTLNHMQAPLFCPSCGLTSPSEKHLTSHPIARRRG